VILLRSSVPYPVPATKILSRHESAGIFLYNSIIQLDLLWFSRLYSYLYFSAQACLNSYRFSIDFLENMLGVMIVRESGNFFTDSLIISNSL